MIVPVYKVEKYLGKCIDSIINQTFKDLEIILVDDGSEDDCTQMCDEYSKMDKRIITIHKKNGGLSSARNAGLKRATGKYIGFVDSDDWIDADMYKHLYNLIEAYNAEIVQCKYTLVIDDESEQQFISSDTSNSNIEIISNDSALNNIYGDRYVETVVMWNKLYKRNLFDEIQFPESKIHEDEFVIHRLLYKTHKVILFNHSMYFYRKNNTSITNSSFNEKKLDKLDAIEERINFFKNTREHYLYKKTLICYKDLLIEFYFKYKFLINDNSSGLKKLKKKYRSIFFSYIFYTNRDLGDRVMSCVFFVDPNVYYKIEKLRKKSSQLSNVYYWLPR